MKPSFFRFGKISRTNRSCWAIGGASDTPVTLPPGLSYLLITLALTGSITVANTMGMSLVAATIAWEVGVVIATMTSGTSPTNLRAICCWVGMLPFAVWYSTDKFLPSLKPRSDRPVCAENLDSDVLVMQPANQGIRQNASDPLNWARDRRILG